MSQFAAVRNRKRRRKRAKGRPLTKRQKQQVAAMVMEPVEKKFYDNSFYAQSVDLVPDWYDLTEIPVGTGMTERIGTNIDILSIQYRLAFTRADATNYIRYVIFQWFPDTLYSGPTWLKMFQFGTAGLPVAQTDIMSPYVLDLGGTSNFKVLVDEQFHLDTEEPVQVVKGFINKGFKKNLEIEGIKGSNHIYLMLVSDSGTVSHPAVNGYTRVRFTDS